MAPYKLAIYLIYLLRRACRHGDRCSRLHNRPTISPTLLMQNMYQNPALNAPPGPDGLPMPVDPRKSQEHFEVRVSLLTAFALLCAFSCPSKLPAHDIRPQRTGVL